MSAVRPTRVIRSAVKCQSFGRYSEALAGRTLITTSQGLPRRHSCRAKHPTSRFHTSGEVTVTILCEPDRELARLLIAQIEGDVHAVSSLPVAAMALAARPERSLIVIGPGPDFEQVLQFGRASCRERV